MVRIEVGVKLTPLVFGGRGTMRRVDDILRSGRDIANCGALIHILIIFIFFLFFVCIFLNKRNIFIFYFFIRFKPETQK